MKTTIVLSLAGLALVALCAREAIWQLDRPEPRPGATYPESAPFWVPLAENDPTKAPEAFFENCRREGKVAAAYRDDGGPWVYDCIRGKGERVDRRSRSRAAPR